MEVTFDKSIKQRVIFVKKSENVCIVNGLLKESPPIDDPSVAPPKPVPWWFLSRRTNLRLEFSRLVEVIFIFYY